MGKTYTISLDRNDLGQLLDGLRSRAESWHDTAGYLSSGDCHRDSFIIEECSDAEEARAIGDHFERIISTIETQLKAQEASP